MTRSALGSWAIRGAGFAAGALAVAVLALAVLAASGVVVLVFVSVLLASALEPIVGWIRGHVPLGRGPTILFVYAAFFAVVLGLAFLVAPAAIGQFNEAIGRLPAFLDRAREWAAELRPAALAASVGALVGAAERTLTPPPPGPDEVVEVGLTVAEVAVSVGSVLAIVFFWLVEHARLQRYALAFLPLERRAGAREAWNAVETRLGLWVRGQLTLMAVMGIATGIAYTVLGLPSPLLLALIAAICEAIPIVGPLLGAVPAVLVAVTISPELALLVAGVYVVLQVVEGNVLVPIVMRNTIGISPFLVIVSLLVGAAIGGVPGALLAVPVVATIEIILERLQARAVPVAQDAAAVDAASGELHDAQEQALPEARPRARARPG
jgi:predicted PurR-regulated permease PerM